MNNKVKGIIFIIFIVVILSSGILIAYNYYLESPNKGTNITKDIDDTDDDQNGNTTTLTTSTTTVTTTDGNDINYNTTRRVVRRTTRATTTETTVVTTTNTTTTTTTTTQAPEVLLLESGDITKPDTNGSVTYNFYSSGDLIIDGTGDAVMRDFSMSDNVLEWDSLIININTKMFWDAVKEKEPSFDLDELLSTEEGQTIYIGINEMCVLLKLGNTDNIIQYLKDGGMSEEEAINTIYGGLSAIFIGDIPTVFNILNTLEYVFVDNLIISKNVKVIGNLAFVMNDLDTITIPSNITTINYGAFINSGINEVVFDDIENSKLTSIGINAFGVNNLTTITIPSSVTTIDGGAFAENHFESINILSKPGFPSTRFNENWLTIGFPAELMPSD